MTQYGFFFDQSRCYDCKACSLACKTHNGIGPGAEKWLRMFEWEEGVFPKTRLKALFAPCYHCAAPACLNACAAQAIIKDEAYGTVLVDSALCVGCRSCLDACVFGAPQFASDDAGAKMSKCTMCIDRLAKGQMPLCVLSCPLRALDFGPLADLEEKYGAQHSLDGMPDAVKMMPSVVFKPQPEKQPLVEYDVANAYSLMAARGELPPLYNSSAGCFDSGEGIVGRAALNMRPATTAELLYLTQNDEG